MLTKQSTVKEFLADEGYGPNCKGFIMTVTSLKNLIDSLPNRIEVTEIVERGGNDNGK